ncbi:NADP-dependent oxidoreductase [Chitinophaga nivalis]|uniref:NADP-dependent oxidoreductase n=1 Tax=Chitinophaga nivalis TaxID=2991709 RepID=A0ABT3ITN9_9BACT|nr:NADP-dependent oxidoreductase [Chitinophaga nivalis]MCW3462972.1 NADP-dependent oxidoreductase [Chitinophaga nivalis]MCW3487338.1 NADP-dependent oxidoreductase [Chitinophaga nivalis]
MKAIIVEKLDGSHPLTISETPAPIIAPHEVLIRNKAIGINPVDYKTFENYIASTGVRASAAPALEGISPLILGWDMAGVVTAVGSDVTKFNVGDEVFGMIHFPGHGRVFAEYVAAPATHLAKKPAHLSFEEAAAATLAAYTAWQNFNWHYPLKKGDRILITAPAGGVGHYAVQLARHMGAHVIAITSAANAEWVKELGAHEVLDYQTFDLETADSLQLNLVLDSGGRMSPLAYEKHLLPGGTLLFLPHGLSQELQQHFRDKGLELRYTAVASDESTGDAIAQLLAAGHLRSVVAEVFPFTAMKAAFEAQKQGTARGKIVVRVTE